MTFVLGVGFCLSKRGRWTALVLLTANQGYVLVRDTVVVNGVGCSRALSLGMQSVQLAGPTKSISLMSY